MASGHVHIESGGVGANTHVSVNGVRVRGVKSITWKCDAAGRAVAVIELHATLDADAALNGVIQWRESDERRPWWAFWR